MLVRLACPLSTRTYGILAPQHRHERAEFLNAAPRQASCRSGMLRAGMMRVPPRGRPVLAFSTPFQRSRG